MSRRQRRQERLEAAARVDDVDALCRLLKEDPWMLQRVEAIPFADTPLHIAAASGRTYFGLEVLRLQPSFGSKLNPDGFSPLHLALQCGHVTTVERLVRKDPELIRVKGKDGYTPLHYAAKIDSADIVGLFLLICPDSAKDLTTSGETAVHIAVREGNIATLEVILGWLSLSNNEDLLGWKDHENGCSALHVAAEANQPEVVNLLIGKVPYVNQMNNHGLTALDIAERLPINENSQRVKESLARAKASRSADLGSKIQKPSQYLASYATYAKRTETSLWDLLYNGLTNEVRNILLVVAVLVATASYQTALQLPGGVSQPDSPAVLPLNSTAINATVVLSSSHQPVASGNITYMNATVSFNFTNENHGQLQPGIVAIKDLQFDDFVIYNTICFGISIIIIFLLLPPTNFNILIYLALMFLVVSYVASLAVILPQKAGLDYIAAYYLSFGTVVFVAFAMFLLLSFRLRREKPMFYIDGKTYMISGS